MLICFQCEFKETGVVVVVVNVGAGKALAVARAAGVTAVAQITDVNELKILLSNLLLSLWHLPTF